MSEASDVWRIVIPTRDSARYISVFFEHYQAIRLNPLYVVDGRSADDTHEILLTKGADVHVINPSGAFGVTELIQAACDISRARWIVRLDDDEFPSKAMLTYISDYIARNRDGNDKETIRFNREWLKRFDGDFVFFRSPKYLSGDSYDGQYRLFYNRGLKFEHNIHTSGIATRHLSSISAPSECFIVHFDAVLKTTSEKLKKMRKYEAIEPGSAWRFSDLYLTEVYSDADAYVFHKRDIEQFASLIKELPLFANLEPPILSNDEYRMIAATCGRGLKPRSDLSGVGRAVRRIARAVKSGKFLCPRWS